MRPSIEEPLLYERVNVGGTANLLQLCREFKVRKFIFGSSSSVYGVTSHAPFSEDQVELRPISPYAATKLAGEMLAFTYAHLFSLSAVCLRFFTVYGARQRPDLAIHKFTALIEMGLTVPVFGDGTSGRDYTFVDDIVAGATAALDYEPPSSTGLGSTSSTWGTLIPSRCSNFSICSKRLPGARRSVSTSRCRQVTFPSPGQM